MEQNFYIKYTAPSNNFDLTTLGESFIGFQSVFNELFEITEIQGELVIRTKKISEGSIEVHLVFQLISSVPFKTIPDLLNFLKLADQSAYQEALTFFSGIGNDYKSLEEFFTTHPLLLSAGFLPISYCFNKMIDKSGVLKNAAISTVADNLGIPFKYAKRLQQMINNGKYKKVVAPLVENTVSEIALSTDNTFREKVSITEENFENYLSEEEKILPELENGTTHEFTGEILALQSTRGETLKFKAYGIDPKYDLLIAHPAEGTKTEDYKEFYKKEVFIVAEIYRKTFYKKPELLIKQIRLVQQALLPN